MNRPKHVDIVIVGDHVTWGLNEVGEELTIDDAGNIIGAFLDFLKTKVPK